MHDCETNRGRSCEGNFSHISYPNRFENPFSIVAPPARITDEQRGLRISTAVACKLLLKRAGTVASRAAPVGGRHGRHGMPACAPRAECHGRSWHQSDAQARESGGSGGEATGTEAVTEESEAMTEVMHME